MSATRIGKPVAIAGTCGIQKPIAAAITANTASDQSRLKSTAPGSSSGSDVDARAPASSRPMSGVGALRRPSQSPISAATLHQAPEK